MSTNNLKNQGIKVVTEDCKVQLRKYIETWIDQWMRWKIFYISYYPKDDKETITAINKAIEQARKDGVSKFGGKIPGNSKDK